MSCDKCNGAHPSFCVSQGLDKEIVDESLKEYKKKKNQKVMQASAETEFEYYCQATRVEETMLWAKKTGSKKDWDCKLCRTVKGKPDTGIHPSKKWI